MSVSRRTLVAAAAGGGGLAGGAQAATDDVAALVRLSESANDALMRGDVRRYRALVPIAEDFTLMSPFGGKPTHAATLTEQTWTGMETFFRNGSLRQEVVQTYASPEMIVLAVIERADVEVGGLPRQPWALRVTLVYRRDGGRWALAHRHADPLAPGISVQQAAALARGAGG